MSEQQKILDGQQAEQILESEVFKKALQNLKEEYIQHWLNNIDVDAVSLREDIHKAILLLPQIEKHLRIIVEKGKISKFQAEKLKKVK
jgi:hypothetical protein|tara:strand:+ start:7887 stop:8150 length:264 start_codon:yes stop_codon:yes gene_type:complete